MSSPKDKDGHEQDFFDGIDATLPGLATGLGEEEKKVPWLRGELESIASDLKHAADKSESDPASAAGPLSQVIERLDGVDARLTKSEVAEVAKNNLLAILREKLEQAEIAISLALDVNLKASVASPTNPGNTPELKDALTVVSPAQRLQVVASLHNGSKYWLAVGGVGPEPFPGLGEEKGCQ